MELKISKSRESDRAWRVELLAQMKIDIENNRPLTAKKIGEMTKYLDDRIKTHDYTEDDARAARLNKLLKAE